MRTLLLFLAFSASATGLWASTAPPLTPMPQSQAKLYSKISGLWAGNKLLYCKPDLAIAQTLTEIRKLHGVRVAAYDSRSAEIVVTMTDGTKGLVDVDNLPKTADHPNCLRDR